MVALQVELWSFAFGVLFAESVVKLQLVEVFCIDFVLYRCRKIVVLNDCKE